MNVQDFETQRRYLLGLAYRMLGSVADAEDMVQETFVRWRDAGQPELRHPRAWFTKTCTRLCLDRLKSARHERERYVGEWLPEPFVPESGAAAGAELDETLSLALLTTIERLQPAQRAAFLLHDVFGYAFDEVAEILDLSPANCRQLAVRARRGLKVPRGASSASRDEVRRLSEAFFEAISTGDDAALRSVLSGDVVLTADGGGKAAAAPRPIEGAKAVVTFLLRVLRPPAPDAAIPTRAVEFNGAPGVLVFEDGEPVSAFHFSVEEGRIAAIYAVRNPDKLQAFQEPRV